MLLGFRCRKSRTLMPITVDMISEDIESPDDYHTGGDCEQCGKEDVWLNFLGVCKGCEEQKDRGERDNGRTTEN